MLVLVLAACTDATVSFGPKGADTGAADGDTGGGSDSAPDTDSAVDTDTGPGDTDTAGDTGPVDDPDALWAAFEDAREDHLRALGVPILACVARDDSSAAAFDGCYDWHSAVHGHWALFALARLLDDPAYAEAAEAQLTEEDLAIELRAIAANRLGEVPYGYAWFLLLARERAAQGGTDLEPLGDAAAEVLDAHLAGLTPVAARNAALADDYQNASWAALNLWRWAVDVGDADMAGRAEAFVRDRLVPLDADCPLEEDLTDTDNFFPACLMRAHAILTVLPSEEGGAWLAAALPSDYGIAPVTSIRSAHTSGLNFSRTWGFWSVYGATSDPAWRDRFREHVEWHMAHPEYWAEDYFSYSHWVAQFGVYALALTAE